jgi:uncharacterized membrane protein YebE (DUF533 family)
LALVLVAAGALGFKAWWNSQREQKNQEATDQRLEHLEQKTQEVEATVDSLSEGTRARLDSVRAWVQVRAQEIGSETDAGRLDLAKKAWQDAKDKLPADLSAYERKIALKEVKTTIVTWFKLSADDWKSITKDG